MTSISSAPAAFNFSKDMFSDASMRPYLEEYYEDSYAPMRERVATMKEAEEKGQAPKTVQIKGGGTAIELSAAQYESMIPSFDKWLELQQHFSTFDLLQESMTSELNVQQSLDHIDRDLNPDRPSDVRTVFSNGDQILGYINESGSVVTHDGGAVLQKIAERADKLQLTGQEKIAYIEQQGKIELSRRYSNLNVETYNGATVPTRREFAERWYPGHDVDATYKNMIEELQASLEQQKSWHAQQVENLNNMREALLKIMEEAQAA